MSLRMSNPDIDDISGLAVLVAKFHLNRRLNKQRHYKRVFKFGKKIDFPAFSLYYCPNQCGHARIGLAVSKKNVPKAVDRNQIKRVIRESFRQRMRLPAVDIAVIVKRSCPITKTTTSKTTNKVQLSEALGVAWKKVEDLCEN